MPRAAQEGARAIAPSPALAEVLEMIETGVFSPGEPDRFAMLTRAAPAAATTQAIVADFDLLPLAVRGSAGPTRCGASCRTTGAAACVRNIAGMSWFSADRAIGEYAKSVWQQARF